MRKSMRMIAWLCGVAALMVSGASFAAGNAAAGKKLFEEGNDDKGITACQSCHGDKGQGNDAMGAPRLAGQGTTYIVKQLNDFANDKRMPAGAGVVMPGFAKAMSDQDKADIAAYVRSLKTNEMSDLKELASDGTKVGVPYKGQIIVEYGIKDKVSSCQSCHSYNGRGAAPMFPMIGQQRYTYIVNQLHNWRANAADKANVDMYSERTNDPVVDGVGIMREVAKNLTDDDINDVAAFLANAPETTAGNHRVPSQH